MLKLSGLSRIKGFQFPRAVIGYAVWAYHRFALSLREVEDPLASRGIRVSYETVRHWVALWRAVDANCPSRQIASRSPAGQWMYWIFWFSRVGTQAPPSTSCETVPAMGSAARAGHGQVRFLGRGQSRDIPRDRTSPAQGVEQSGRSLASTHPTTREEHEALQVPGSGATVPLNARTDRHLVPPKTPSPLRPIGPPRED